MKLKVKDCDDPVANGFRLRESLRRATDSRGSSIEIQAGTYDTTVGVQFSMPPDTLLVGDGREVCILKNGNRWAETNGPIFACQQGTVVEGINFVASYPNVNVQTALFGFGGSQVMGGVAANRTPAAGTLPGDPAVADSVVAAMD